MHKKKSEIDQQLVLLVILVAAGLVITSAAIAFVNFFKSSSDIEACRLSVLAHAQTKKIGPIDLAKSVLSIDCPRREVEFFKNKIEIDGKESKEYSFNELDDNTVNNVIADELASCWYKLGQGEIDVFDRAWFLDVKNVCLVCSEVKFNENVKKDKFENLDNFIKKATMKNTGTTYYNYLTKGQRDRYLNLGVLGTDLPWTQCLGGWRDASSNLVEEDQKFDKNNQYTVYFLAYKPSWFNDKILQSYDAAYYVGLGKASKLTRECNLLVN